MSAPYFVLVSVPSGHQLTIEAGTFDEALAVRDAEEAKSGPRDVRVYGESYDVDCDADGYFVADDGLTDAERDLLDVRACERCGEKGTGDDPLRSTLVSPFDDTVLRVHRRCGASIAEGLVR